MRLWAAASCSSSRSTRCRACSSCSSKVVMRSSAIMTPVYQTRVFLNSIAAPPARRMFLFSQDDLLLVTTWLPVASPQKGERRQGNVHFPLLYAILGADFTLTTVSQQPC